MNKIKIKPLRKDLKSKLNVIKQNAEKIQEYIIDGEKELNKDDFFPDFTKMEIGDYFKFRKNQLFASLIIETMSTIEGALKIIYQVLDTNADIQELHKTNVMKIISKFERKTSVKMDQSDFRLIQAFIEKRNILVHEQFNIAKVENNESNQYDYVISYINSSSRIINQYLKDIEQYLKKKENKKGKKKKSNE